MKRLAILLVLLTAEAFAAVYPTAQVGEAVKIPHVSTTGTAPFVWSISAGALPPGLALNTATGTISGTAITAGTYQWTLTVKGKAATTWTRTEYMMVVSVPAPPPPPPSPPPPPASTGNTPVSGAQPSPTTATAGLSWQPSSPAVAGYNVYRDGARRNASPLNALTYSDGPLPPGIYRYTVRAVDAAGVESVDSGAVAAMVP